MFFYDGHELIGLIKLSYLNPKYYLNTHVHIFSQNQLKYHLLNININLVIYEV
jgi:hypothetical protein